MTITDASTPERTGAAASMVSALIVTEGLLTVLACCFAFPVGVALVLANGVAAIVSRGAHRRLFAGFTIAGAAVCLVVLLFAVAVSSTVEIGPATRL